MDRRANCGRTAIRNGERRWLAGGAVGDAGDPEVEGVGGGRSSEPGGGATAECSYGACGEEMGIGDAGAVELLKAIEDAPGF